MTFEDKTKTPRNEGGSLRTERVCGFSFLVVSLAVPDYFQVVGTAQKNKAQRLFCCSRLPCPEETVRVMSSPICPILWVWTGFLWLFLLQWTKSEDLLLLQLLHWKKYSWHPVMVNPDCRFDWVSNHPGDSLWAFLLRIHWGREWGAWNRGSVCPLLLPEWVCLHIHWWKCPLLRLSVWAPCSDSPDIIRLPAPAWLLLSFECGSHIAILCFSMCKPRQHPLPVSMYILLVLFTFLSP